MVTSQFLEREQLTVEDKWTGARNVAYIRFYGLNEVGRRIWMVRDWLLGNHIQMIGSPSCIFYLGNNGIRAAQEDSLCEVQWDLPTPVGQSASATVGGDNAGCRGNGDSLQRRGWESDGSVKIKRVEPERVLSVIHRGDTDTISRTICLLENALHEAGYEKACLRREIYMFDVHLPKSRWVTEIQVPVMIRGAFVSYNRPSDITQPDSPNYDALDDFSSGTDPVGLGGACHLGTGRSQAGQAH